MVSGKIPYTEQQILDIGLTVIQNTGDFERSLGEWAVKTAQFKTWILFQDHFRKAQKSLQKIRGPTMQQAGLQQPNMMAKQVHNEMQDRNSEVVTVL